MRIYYGIKNNMIDITSICLSKLTHNDIITIPSGDGNRAYYFTDPLIGVLKEILIIDDNNEYYYNSSYSININLSNNTITIHYNEEYKYDKINYLHSKLIIKHGNLNEELPEQMMAVKYLTGNEKVLEIGGNIGRNSLIIASIVNNNNFVTLECDENIAKQLTENKELNNFTFNIENSALSNKKLIQNGWTTIPSEELLDGCKWVNTITLNELNNKYNIIFDTLVLDCEGAFYYILYDMPEILNNIKLIIMENDYIDIYHKKYIDEVLIQNNFSRDYVESGGWGPCFDNFYEVWKLNN